VRIGFIGLGSMGQAMAGRLLAAGHEIFVWGRRIASTNSLVEQGATLCSSPAALAKMVEVVCTNVTSSADVDGLVRAEDGLLAGLVGGAMHIDFSTIAPEVARRIASDYAARGVDFIDAPVSGGSGAAQSGTLAIMWGGCEARADELAERLKPIFDCIGKTTVYVGAPGAGQVAKACNQMVMVAAIEAVAEAALLAGAHHLDFAKVHQAMNGGSAASRVLEVFGGRMVQRDFAAGVEARLHHKDFGLLLGEAVHLGAPLPIAATVAQQLNALMSQGGAKHDTSALLRVLERSAKSVQA
jgi:2-hydroxy-3-oxopropionate reductase